MERLSIRKRCYGSSTLILNFRKLSKNLITKEVLEDPRCMNLVLGGYGGIGPGSRYQNLLKAIPELKAKQLKHLADVRPKAANVRRHLYRTNSHFRQQHLEAGQKGAAASAALFAADDERRKSRHQACLEGRQKWQAENPEAHEILKQNGKRSWEVRQAIYDQDPEAKERMLQRMSDNRGNAHTDDANKLRSQSLKQRYATQGHSHKGRAWICHPDGRSTLVSDPEAYLKDGWVLGRKIKALENPMSEF